MPVSEMPLFKESCHAFSFQSSLHIMAIEPLILTSYIHLLKLFFFFFPRTHVIEVFFFPGIPQNIFTSSPQQNVFKGLKMIVIEYTLQNCNKCISPFASEKVHI